MRNLVALGYIAKAFGIKGGVSIKLFSEESEAIKEGVTLLIRKGSSEKELTVQEVLPGGRLFFVGMNDRTVAESLRGAEIFIERSKLPELLDDEFYLSDIIGAEVVLSQGEKVGTVVDFSSNGAQTLLEVKTVAGHVASIPLVDAIVKNIDSVNKVVIIDPPEGLLDA